MNQRPSSLPDRYVGDPVRGIWARPEFSGIAYSDGDQIEEHLAQVLAKTEDVSILSPELAMACKDWVTLYHFSSIRANLLRPFEAQLHNAQVLEIGAGCGAITRYLGEAGAEVLALEGSVRRASIARARTRDLPNVNLVAEDFQLFETEARFDVITLIGVLEYAALYTQGPDPALEMLKKVKSFLKPDGKLIIAIENQLGLKYFAGSAEDHIGIPFYGVEGRYRHDQVRTFGRQQLRERILSAGFSQTRLLLPLPDYKLPVSIVAEEALANSSFDSAIFFSMNTANDPQKPRFPYFVQELVWPEIVRNGIAADLSNSFLFVAGNSDLADNSLAWHFSINGRKPEFTKATSFTLAETGEITVNVQAVGGPAHLVDLGDLVYEPQAEAPYLAGATYDLPFAKIASAKVMQLDDVTSYFTTYFEHLKTIARDENILDKASLALPLPELRFPGVFLDAVPRNIMTGHDGAPRFFDREWRSQDPLTPEYLLFRSLLTLVTRATVLGKPSCDSVKTNGDLIRYVLKHLGLTCDKQAFDAFVAAEARFNHQVLLGGDADEAWFHNVLSAMLAQPLKDRTLVASALETTVSELNDRGVELDIYKQQLRELNNSKVRANEDLSPGQAEMIEIASKLEASEHLANELSKRVMHITAFANDLLNSKWWRMTRHFRRWSNSLRKRRGRPKKRWPDQISLPAISVQMHPTGVNEELWPSYTPIENVISPFGRSNAGPNVPVVPYSNVQEDFVNYVEHDPIEPLVRTIAFYLPQFHPFAQNDRWWGKGFTEWTNVGKARPLFPGHHQPHCPIHLGYYDLRIPQIMQEQAKLAKNYGVSGFAYYFYWFAGQLLMEAPLEAMLADPDVDLPFCMIWANENWTRRWDGQDQEVLIAQDHSLEDSRSMLIYLKKFMEDKRYIRVNGKPLFIIYRAALIPDFAETLKMWRSEAKRMGLGDLYVVSAQTFGHTQSQDLGLDAAMEFPPHGLSPQDISMLIPGLVENFDGGIYEYSEVVSNAVMQKEPDYLLFRTSMLSWDNTARRNLSASIFADFSVTRYTQWLASNIERAAKDPARNDSERLIFINAWNEWAEGTHLEPDQKHGYGYLEATRSVVSNYSKTAECFMRPVVPDTTTNRFAIVAHLHYSDTWPELRDVIAKLNNVDFYFTVTNVVLAQTIAADMPSAIVELVDNRGRDVRPFLMTMQRISHLGYRAVCKVHDKKSVYRTDGEKMRRQFFSTLINAELMSEFDLNDRLGLLALDSSLLEHNDINMKNNQKMVDDISLEMGIPFVRGKFAAGTMFWVDPRAIAPILKLAVNDFDIERGLVVGTRAHAIERLFCNVCEASDFKVSTTG